VLDESHIEILTYDRLLDRYRLREEHWEAWDKQLLSMSPDTSTLGE
jgi:hypothetical protein